MYFLGSVGLSSVNLVDYRSPPPSISPDAPQGLPGPVGPSGRLPRAHQIALSRATRGRLTPAQTPLLLGPPTHAARQTADCHPDSGLINRIGTLRRKKTEN